MGLSRKSAEKNEIEKKLENCCSLLLNFLVFKALASTTGKVSNFILQNLYWNIRLNPKILLWTKKINFTKKERRQEEKLLRIFGSLVTHS